MTDTKRKQPKLKTQLPWKREYLFSQFSSQKIQCFAKLVENIIKGSKKYTSRLVEGC